MSKIGMIFHLSGPDPFQNFDRVLKDFCEYLKIRSPNVDKFSEVFDIPTFVGIEIEVENLPRDIVLPKFWMSEKDSSLRNGGREYKSWPIAPKEAFLALELLWQLFKRTAKPDFSWRSAIHFHLNATALEEEEFKRLLILCLLFEPFFFHLVGEDREQNPYCVPLTNSTLMGNLRKYIQGKQGLKLLQHFWNGSGGSNGEPKGAFKYSAVNCTRLSDLGTIEFRHLGGTGDLNLITTCLVLALKLYKAAVVLDSKELQNTIFELNTTKQYEAFTKKIFGKHASLFSLEEKPLLARSVTKVKELLVPLPKFEGCRENSSMMEYAEVIHKKRSSERKEAPKRDVKKPSGM